MGDKQNDVVILNPKKNKETKKYIYTTMYVQINDTHISRQYTLSKLI